MTSHLRASHLIMVLVFAVICHQTVLSASIDRDLKVRRFNLKTKDSNDEDKKASYYVMTFRNGFQPTPTSCKATEYVQTMVKARVRYGLHQSLERD